ncbi:MAG TPA: leucine-rich repeat domain-containing protein [Candidatus Acidoferrales bacterium]|jgi:hypothetical protein|nr:leucine-rich repeat domain-containing protein [Candidatus Acidoferrales bacterium]
MKHLNQLVILAAWLVLTLPQCGLAQFTFFTNNGAITITSYTGSGGYVTIPGSTNGYPVTAIKSNAFSSTFSITGVTIPDSVTNIGIWAFFNCPGLASATIGNGVASIGDYAFDSCHGLTNVTIGNSVASIGNYVFYSCYSLPYVTIPASVTNLGLSVFASCNALTNISVSALNPRYTGVSGVLIDQTRARLIACPGGFTGTYTVPDNITSIGDDAFDICHLTGITIPNSVTAIGNNAFNLCSSLGSITIPNSVTNIGGSAFGGCTSLHQAYFMGNAPLVNGVAGSLDGTVFLNLLGTVYYVPGTMGWGASYGSWPTAQWFQPAPQILGNGNGFGARSNRFNFTISWATNTSVVVEGSTNMFTWTAIATNSLAGGTNAFSDPSYTNYPCRFYRVRSP